MDYRTGPLGVGGGGEEAARLVFRGRLGPAFVRFVLERAARLDLRGHVLPDDAAAGAAVRVVVSGPSALIDAFEIACCLGPIDTLVEDWDREPADPAAGVPERAIPFAAPPPG